MESGHHKMYNPGKKKDIIRNGVDMEINAWILKMILIVCV